MDFIPATGAIISPDDYRDKIVYASLSATTRTVTLPASFNSTLASHVMMQAQIPACVAHSAVDVLKLWWFTMYGEWVDFSPRFLDILAKRFDGQPFDGGTIPRLVFKLMATYGCATTATLPNDTSLSITQYRNDALLTPAVMAEAAKFKIHGFVRVPLDQYSTRAAIMQYGALSTLFVIGKELWTPSWLDKDIDPLRPPAAPVSGHEMTQKGWQGPYHAVRNIWSDQWANKGEAQFDPAPWSHFIAEQWAIAYVSKDIKDFLALLPSPDDFHYQWTKTVMLGDKGPDVQMLQAAFMMLGYMKVVAPDEFGVFGPKTAAANLAFQMANKITSTAPNIVGPLTRAALNKRFAL